MSPLPLYHQLAELLSARISRGELAPGARLPSEPALSKTHGIGRPTVRQALDVLAERGLIERRRGSGTYVREPRRQVDLFSLAGTLSSFARSGVELETSIVKRTVRVVVEEDAEHPLSGREAFAFQRLARADGRPVLFERMFLDPAVFPEFNRLPLAGESLSRLVEERYYLRPSHAVQTFCVVIAPEEASALELARREPILLVRRTLHFPSAGPAIFAELYCRTDDLLFTQTIGASTDHA
jgi:GntR family transcriptional regulator